MQSLYNNRRDSRDSEESGARQNPSVLWEDHVTIYKIDINNMRGHEGIKDKCLSVRGGKPGKLGTSFQLRKI